MSFIDKIKDLVNVPDDDYEEDDYMEEEYEVEEKKPKQDFVFLFIYYYNRIFC